VSPVLQVLSLLLQLVTWGLLVAFGLWLYRRLPLRSLPWAGAYMLLTMPLLEFTNKALFSWFFGKQTLPFGGANAVSRGGLAMQTISWSYLLGAVAGLLLTLLILSDVVFLLARAGIEPDNKSLRRLLMVRQWSTPLGFTLILFTLMAQLLVLLLQIFI
jgi:hypothetical protein